MHLVSFIVKTLLHPTKTVNKKFKVEILNEFKFNELMKNQSISY